MACPKTSPHSILKTTTPLISRAENGEYHKPLPLSSQNSSLPHPTSKSLTRNINLKKKRLTPKKPQPKDNKLQQNTRKPPADRPKNSLYPILTAKKRFSGAQKTHNRLSIRKITKKQMTKKTEQPESKMKKNPPKHNSLHLQRTMPFASPKMHHAYPISSNT